VRALVTGGGGFLGGTLVRRLLREGHDVASYARGDYPELAALGVRCLRGDIADASGGPELKAALEGVDTVFHVAAKAGVWGRREEYFSANVEGTRNVLQAAREMGIERFVYTSSPSVCFDGADHLGAGNDLPYATRFLAAYPESKAIAERLVLEADDEGLATCALRPHLIIGPGDPHILPRLVQRARAGRLAIVGRGDNRVSCTDVENAAAAHIDAALALEPGAAHAGRAYFIGQEEPIRLWVWINDVLSRVGLPPVSRKLPEPVARFAGSTLELAWRLTGAGGEPPMTRFLALQLARSHTYDLGPAKRDFGYRERITLEEATERAIADLRDRALV
jgi:nucleoside-diphosphate-sugar epimerase